jgi:hypothetical protein
MRETGVFTSVATPGWKFKTSRERARIINPYTKSWFKETIPDCTLYQRANTGNPATSSDNWYEGGITSLINPGTSVDTLRAEDPANACAAKLLSRLSTQKTSLLVTIAEFNKTSEMIFSTATRLANAIRAARRFDLPGMLAPLGIKASYKQERRFSRRLGGFKKKFVRPSLGQIEDFASQTWLEYTYGWRPLLSDIHSSAEALATALTERAFVTRVEVAKHTSTLEKSASTPSAQFRFTSTILETRKIKMGVYYSLPDGPATVANTFGLLNPLEVAWELVPFSFVADWFLPIGQGIRNITSTTGLTYHRGYRSSRDVIGIKQYWTPGNPFLSNGVLYTAHGSGYRERKYVYIVRNSLPSFPSVDLPAFRLPSTAGQALSGIALLQSLFLKGR